MIRSVQEEKRLQVLQGICFVSAVLVVMAKLVVKLGYCCEWFSFHLRFS